MRKEKVVSKVEKLLYGKEIKLVQHMAPWSKSPRGKLLKGRVYFT